MSSAWENAPRYNPFMLRPRLCCFRDDSKGSRTRLKSKYTRKTHACEIKYIIIIIYTSVSVVIGSRINVSCNRQPRSALCARAFSTGLAPQVRVKRKRSAVTMLYKLCPCCAGYVIVANTVTLVPKRGLLSSQML